MAESVQYYLERMIPELEGLEEKRIFTPVEIKSIIKKRTNFEYALQRRIKKKIDFLRAIEYEINLEELRKKRVSKLGLKGSLKGDDLQYSGARRIYSLFKRATIKFKGDISLWLQYIDYAKQNGANNVLSSIFVQAIQYNPNNASLWIMAATWEYEHNQNMAAARILLQRAIRLMPQSQQLWHEYFRLELLYIEKIKLRRRILGIHQQKNEEIIEPTQNDDDDNTIQLPAITGEDMEAFREEETDKKKSKLTEQQMAALEEENNPILQGLLAKIVYDNAIAAITHNLEFRQKFVEIYKEFTDTQKHIGYVYETIQRDMNDVPAARAYLAKRHLGTTTLSDPAFIPALKQCVETFDQTLVDLVDSSEMWELYIKFLLEWYMLVSEANLKLYLSSMLQKTFKACHKHDKKMNPTLYEMWTQYLINEKQEEKALRVVSEGIQTYPQAVMLWTYLVELNSDDKKLQHQLFKDALEENPASLVLWTTYKNWMTDVSGLSVGEIEALMMKACEMVTMLLPSVTVESEDRNRIKDMLQASFVEWAAETQGIQKARAVYQQIIKSFYPTYAFFMRCVELENEYGSGDSAAQESVEYLYDRLTRLDERKEDSYLSYLSYLYSQKKLQKANQVYLRACKEVANKEAFDIQVQKLRNQKTTLL